MMAVQTTVQPAFTASKPKLIFGARYDVTTGTNPFYDVSADGKHFLMLKPNDQQQAPNQIAIVLNWAEGLKK